METLAVGLAEPLGLLLAETVRAFNGSGWFPRALLPLTAGSLWAVPSHSDTNTLSAAHSFISPRRQPDPGHRLIGPDQDGGRPAVFSRKARASGVTADVGGSGSVGDLEQPLGASWPPNSVSSAIPADLTLNPCSADAPAEPGRSHPSGLAVSAANSSPFCFRQTFKTRMRRRAALPQPREPSWSCFAAFSQAGLRDSTTLLVSATHSPHHSSPDVSKLVSSEDEDRDE